jgi:hypothetical protein
MISWTSMVLVVISPFAFLILLIWVFSLLILVRFARGLSILFIFSKNQLFVSLILCMVFLVSTSSVSALIFIISHLFVLGFASSCLCRSLRCIIRPLIWDRSVVLMYALLARPSTYTRTCTVCSLLIVLLIASPSLTIFQSTVACFGSTNKWVKGKSEE